ncbi:hypothetical protein [Candidatus Reidiella endopervernicosa]|uniref:Uncharacterized protein n=1 Tax=Candidatus Reidiella endopervernicosa TaxID=2738883 RepID=A0A6N0HWI0_9GAMM|nr:hypothetical protein [Candidatus Reidiella endopervernicosa]QKQ26621.1 hypothetical protein HUE57_10275 [Candidatus Reidiella endopervernicosa]
MLPPNGHFISTTSRGTPVLVSMPHHSKAELHHHTDQHAIYDTGFTVLHSEHKREQLH